MTPRAALGLTVGCWAGYNVVMSESRRERWMLITASLIILATVALGFVLWFTRAVMIPFVLAIFVVAVVAPLADWLEVKGKFRRWLSVPLVMVLVLIATVSVLLLLTYTAGEVVKVIPQYGNNVFAIAEQWVAAVELEEQDRAVHPGDRLGKTSGNELPADIPETSTTTPEESTLSSAGAEPGRATGPALHTVEQGTENGGRREPNAIEPNKADLGNGADLDGDSSLFDLDWLQRFVANALKQAKRDWQGYVPQAIAWVFGQVQTIVATVSTFFLMTIFVFFLLVARDPSRLQLSGYAVIERQMRRYLMIKTSISAMTGIFVGVVLGVLGMPLAVVFGVLTFLLNFIPSIGSIIATLLPLPIAYAEFVLHQDPPSHVAAVAAVAAEDNMPDHVPSPRGESPSTAQRGWWQFLTESGWLRFLAILLIPGGVQIFIGNVIEPRVMGEGLELHPVVILIALVFWGLLWGPMGAILAVPITAVIRIVTSRFISLKMVSDVMAGRLPA
jgi:AI-2 transport protein TqsA